MVGSTDGVNVVGCNVGRGVGLAEENTKVGADDLGIALGMTDGTVKIVKELGEMVELPTGLSVGDENGITEGISNGTTVVKLYNNIVGIMLVSTDGLIDGKRLGVIDRLAVTITLPF